MRKKSYIKSSRKQGGGNYFGSNFIGRTIAADSYPSTIAAYWFVLAPGSILNTFDFVTVDNFESKTIGLIQDTRALPSLDLNGSLINKHRQKNHSIKQSLSSMSSAKQGLIAANVVVIGNTGIQTKSSKIKTINLPILTGLDVRPRSLKRIFQITIISCVSSLIMITSFFQKVL